MSYLEDLKFDKSHLWHPYTSMINPLPVYHVKGARGATIELSDGRELIDGMSSWWSTIHGYNHPRLNQAAKNQIDEMSHVMFGGFTHSPAARLGRNLLQLLPKGLERIFYADSGSVSVEVALKMAIQYQHSRGKGEKNKIATILGGYHGDTWHAMSVCDPYGGMHSLYNGRLSMQYFADMPAIAFDEEWDQSDISSLESIFKEHGDEIAAFILEPIVQGAGGMRFYHSEYLRRAKELCEEYDILLIADEIATGFGRTGRMFACEWAGITPDIMCVGKAITGGYMTFASTITTAKVADTISSSSPCVFMHGPTFMGNPLAAAVAAESLAILIENSPLERVGELESIMRDMLGALAKLESVSDVRVLGSIGVVEMRDAVDMASIQKMFVDHGVWVRPFGKLVYIMPSYVITDCELRRLCQALVEVVNKI